MSSQGGQEDDVGVSEGEAGLSGCISGKDGQEPERVEDNDLKEQAEDSTEEDMQALLRPHRTISSVH